MARRRTVDMASAWNVSLPGWPTSTLSGRAACIRALWGGASPEALWSGFIDEVFGGLQGFILGLDLGWLQLSEIDRQEQERIHGAYTEYSVQTTYKWP